MNANTSDSESSSNGSQIDKETVESNELDDVNGNSLSNEDTSLETSTRSEGLEGDQQNVDVEEKIMVVDPSSSPDVENQTMDNHHPDEENSLSTQGTGISYDQRVARYRHLLQQQEEAVLVQEQEEINGVQVSGTTGAALLDASSNFQLDASHAGSSVDIQKNLGNGVDTSFDVDNELTSLRKNVDGTVGHGTMGVATAASTNDVMDDKIRAQPANTRPTQEAEDEGSSPGAYQVPGRAYGQFPAWGLATHNRQFVWDSQRSGVQVEDNDESSASLGQERRPSVPKVSAHVVDEDEIQNQVRRELLQETVQADIVDCRQINEDAIKRLKRRYLLAAIYSVVAVAMIVGLSVGLTGATNNEEADQNATAMPTLSPTFDPTTTLERAREQNQINCGVFKQLGLYNEANGTGFEMDLCLAVEVAVFGDTADRATPVVLDWTAERFVFLVNRTIDILLMSTTHNMGRDVHEEHSETGFSFSTPYLHDGIGFAGIPEFVDCADNLNPYFGECRLLRVCVWNGTTHVDVVKRVLPEPTIILSDDVWSDFVNKKCNAFADERAGRAESTVRSDPYNYQGLYKTGKILFSKEPLALVTRDLDPEWSGIVDWVIRALLAAEYNNITQENVRDVIGSDNEEAEFFISMIEAVGNYGEIYARNLEDIVPRDEINRLNWNGSTGLIYPKPLGQIQNEGPGPDVGGTLERVFNSSMLACGIVAGERFADYDNETDEWSGLDADFCQAVGASVFNDTSPIITFVQFDAIEEGLLALSSGSVDVMTGVDMNAEGVQFTPSYGSNYSTSPPYYYDPPLGTSPMRVRTRRIATRREDVQWSDFVYWVVSSTFLAEEKIHYQNTSKKMPLVNLFGKDYKQMLQNSIASVGNFGEIYDRNNISRAGRNQLNKNPFGPQHFTFPLPYV